ncbi:CPBP family intramembrane glutamic endopeptidase [Lentibacillus saliphilus]|uniref:CPBP family intramembrane glutamic endopeptidase n=1 Tax=Lentibacillus saliphilus TaxID=2737028 RepID=UPI001FE6BB1C|nr:type II CAAX endopeptidase family protein [Lentibacillus saliphilus]
MLTGRYWGVILAYIIMQFSGLLFAPLLYVALPLTQNEAIVYWSLISFVIGLVVIGFIMKPYMREAPLRNAASKGEIVLWSILGVFMAYMANAIAASIEMYVFGIEAGSENTMMIIDMIELVPLFFIVPTIIAPILEEVIFRKIVFGSLYKRFNFIIAAFISAGVFGVIHGEIEHILIYSAMGFVFAFLYVKTKRLIVPIIVHMTLNSISVILQMSGVLENMEKQLENMEKLQMIFGG